MPAQRPGAPGWLVTAGVAVVFLAVGFAAYRLLVAGSRGQADSGQPALEAPPRPATAAAHPLAKHLEVSGIRITEKAKKAEVRLAVTNHSAAEHTDIDAVVFVRTAGVPYRDVGRATLKIPTLGPHEVRDLTLPLETTLRAYEMPDWQFLRAEFVKPE